MKLVKKIKIFPSINQKNTFDFWLRRTKLLYNTALQQKIETYSKTKQYLSVYDQKKELPDIKDFDSSWKDIPNKSLTEILFRLDLAFKSFFTRGFKGFPKYMKENNSLYFVREDIKFKQNKLFLPKIKTQIKISETLPENYSSGQLIKENNNYFICFTIDIEPVIKDNNNGFLGVDLGLKSLYTDSNKNSIDRFSLKLTKKFNKRIEILNQSLSKKKKGSNRFKKVKQQLGKTYKRLSDSRNDFLHKKSFDLINKTKEDNIIIGDIKVSNIIKKCVENNYTIRKKGLIKNFYNASLSIFKNYCVYKGRKIGKEVKLVKENNSSKTCSCCGWVNESLKLNDRIFNCKRCDNSIDRDYNSSINMKLLGSSIIKGFVNNKKFDSRSTIKDYFNLLEMNKNEYICV